MHASPANLEVIAAEAADWFLRMQHPLHDVQERRAFSEWLMRSPIHVEEFLAVSSTWAVIHCPAREGFSSDDLIEAARHDAESAKIIEFRGPDSRSGAWAPSPVLNLWRGRHHRLVGATALLAIAGAIFGFHSWRPTAEYATAIGEQRSISLADGTLIFLNTNSHVRLRWSQTIRAVELTRGEARFQVAKDMARPFVVATPEATVRAVGTVFNVLAEQKITEVTVIEGRVKVRAHERELRWSASRFLAIGGSSVGDPEASAKAGIDLAAGEQAVVDTGGRIGPTATPTSGRVDAWTLRHLVFRDETLDKVVAEFNRYHATPMVVDDLPLAGMKISGVFDSSDPETLVSYLKTFETVRTRVAADGSLHLSINAAVKNPER